MRKTRWYDYDEETRARWQAASKKARAKLADAFRLRKLERKRSGNGRLSALIRAGREARNQLRAISQIRRSLALMHDEQNHDFVGKRWSIAETTRRLAAAEFKRLTDALEAMEDPRAQVILDRAREVAAGL